MRRIPPSGLTMTFIMVLEMTCPECGRVFDLTNDDDSAEWQYGHDCEA